MLLVPLRHPYLDYIVQYIQRAEPQRIQKRLERARQSGPVQLISAVVTCVGIALALVLFPSRNSTLT
jgi:hypothetical protein